METNQMKRQRVKQITSGSGVGIPVLMVWAMQTYTSVEMPVEVAVAAAGIIVTLFNRVFPD